MTSLLNQRLHLVRKNGENFEQIPASVQKKIYVSDITIPVEEGDVFVWSQPSGVKKRMLATKVTLYNMGSSLDHYEIDYEVE